MNDFVEVIEYLPITNLISVLFDSSKRSSNYTIIFWVEIFIFVEKPTLLWEIFLKWNFEQIFMNKTKGNVLKHRKLNLEEKEAATWGVL